jgi:prepilin-type N-terminal cleavage/methylation domain-containing protein
MRKGFTLIELLIVVAIIAILAAIAIPNFLEAQVRAKVSRMNASLRTAALAMESYFTDYNRYPLTTYAPFGVFPLEEQWKLWPGSLTTPVAFISSEAPLADVFRAAHGYKTQLANEIMYLPSEFYIVPGKYNFTTDTDQYRRQSNRYGYWVIRSAGPDTWYQNMLGDHFDYGGPSGSTWNLASYDPTNGSVSGGDIYRSQKSSDEKHT